MPDIDQRLRAGNRPRSMASCVGSSTRMPPRSPWPTPSPRCIWDPTVQADSTARSPPTSRRLARVPATIARDVPRRRHPPATGRACPATVGPARVPLWSSVQPALLVLRAAQLPDEEIDVRVLVLSAPAARGTRGQGVREQVLARPMGVGCGHRRAGRCRAACRSLVPAVCGLRRAEDGRRAGAPVNRWRVGGRSPR